MIAQKTKHNLKLAFCTFQAAKYACENWHYSKRIPTPPLIKIGVWEKNKFIGCVLFGRGASSNLGKPYNLKNIECCELVRIALTKHETYVSRIIAIAIKILKKNNPKLKLIVSFADTNQNHHGGIYQATGWIYTGVTSKTKKYIYKGKELHSQQVSEKGYNKQYGQLRKCIKPSQCTIIEQNGKHRYLMPLDNNVKNIIQKISLKYPKRAEHESNALTNHVRESGAIPTSTLQNNKIC